ncbi:hypothetical protein [Candidatus Palauibacter sp.]|uniref:hypothetical protein n=1 Tax=Candidatus Palauibacter sp. TaxID=3101350 RepID=UPI003B51B18A
MLTRVRLENFKAWREADVALGRVTGFFGANSAGKSSLLHLLLLLKQTRNVTDRGIVLYFGGRAKMVNLGTFANVVHLHDEERTIRWLLDWTLPKPLKIADQLTRSATPLLEGTSLQTRFEVGLEKAQLSPRELAYRFDDVQGQNHRVRRVAVTPSEDDRRGYDELPENAWKVNEPEAYLYGEDIYGVHSIAYDPVREHETFHAFALRDGDGAFSSFEELEAYAFRARRRAGGRGTAVGATFPGDGVSGQRLQERPGRPCADRRTLDQELATVPDHAMKGFGLGLRGSRTREWPEVLPVSAGAA